MSRFHLSETAGSAMAGWGGQARDFRKTATNAPGAAGANRLGNCHISGYITGARLHGCRHGQQIPAQGDPYAPPSRGGRGLVRVEVQAPKGDAGLIRALAETLRGKTGKAQAVRSTLAKAIMNPEIKLLSTSLARSFPTRCSRTFLTSRANAAGAGLSCEISAGYERHFRNPQARPCRPERHAMGQLVPRSKISGRASSCSPKSAMASS